MNDETTRILSDETAKNGQQSAAQPQSVNNNSHKSAGKGSKTAAAAGGFVAGAAVGAGTTAAASVPSTEPIQAEEVEAETVATEEAPAPEQAILANDEGIRYAHVDADNFSDAFAQARAQVGAGGVFEYQGRLYSTYTAEEWNSMSPAERAEYQSNVSGIASSEHSHNTTMAADRATGEPDVASDAEMVSTEPVDNEILVLGVETVETEDGQIMNVALVECEGDQALLVDVDNNGTIDVLIHDDNVDGEIQESEIHNISDAGLEVADLMQAQAAAEGDTFYASNDGMADYVNDADCTMEV